MAKSRLTSDERQALGALLREPGAPIGDKTVSAVSQRTGLSQTQVRRTLAKLKDLGLVHRELDAPTTTEFWIVLEPALRELEGEDAEPQWSDRDSDE